VEDEVEVIHCVGPPRCPFEDGDAIQNQLDGCPMCKRFKDGELDDWDDAT